MLILIFMVGLALVGGGLFGLVGAGVGLIAGAFVGAALDVWTDGK